MKSLLRIALLFVLGLVLLARGLEYLNDRITAASRPSAPPAVPAEPRPPADAAAREAEPAEAPGSDASLPPPTDAHLEALYAGDEGAVRATLQALPSYAATSELGPALAAAAARSRWPGQQRQIACLRARDPGMPLADLFAALPADPPHDVVWRQQETGCLVKAVAGRATEDPDRAIALLATRAVHGPSPPVLEALAVLDPPALPAAIDEALAPGATRLRRSAAVEAAVAMGAAAKWPDRVRDWLDDADRGVRLTALRALVARRDAASQALAARFIAANPGEEEARRLVESRDRRDAGLVPALVDVVHDESEPAFARAMAARLVGEHGDEAACRLVATVTTADATLAPALAEASRRTTLRFGPVPGVAR